MEVRFLSIGRYVINLLSVWTWQSDMEKGTNPFRKVCPLHYNSRHHLTVRVGSSLAVQKGLRLVIHTGFYVTHQPLWSRKGLRQTKLLDHPLKLICNNSATTFVSNQGQQVNHPVKTQEHLFPSLVKWRIPNWPPQIPFSKLKELPTHQLCHRSKTGKNRHMT